MSRPIEELYEFGDFRLNVGEHLLERLDGTRNRHLPEKAFQTLCFLVRNNGRLLAKKEILEHVWPDSFVEENNLDKCIYAIRQCLGKNGSHKKYIDTVPKHGYRFVADVRVPAATKRADTIAAADSSGDDRSEVDERLSVDNDKRRDPVEALPPLRLRFQIPVLVTLACIAVLIVWFGISMGREAPDRSASANIGAPLSQSSVTGHSNPLAYDLYVRGKVKVASENRVDTEDAIKFFEEAVAIDPNFAEAFAQLARAYNTLAFKFSSDPDRKRLHENAEVAIEKALALNPNLAEGHFARGLILWTNTKRFPHEQAIQSYKRSIALDSTSDETHHQLSIVFAHIGLLDEAQQSLNTALQINPNNTMARYRVGVYNAWQGKPEEAVATFKTIPSDVSPMLIDRSMAELLIQTGRLSEAEAVVDDYLRRYPQDEGGSFTSIKALLLAKAGKHRETEDAIRLAVQIGSSYGHFHHTAYNIASAYSALNDPDNAVRWLETAAESGFPNCTYFEIDPNLNNIRKYERFIEFMKKLRLQRDRFKAFA